MAYKETKSPDLLSIYEGVYMWEREAQSEKF